MPQTKLANLINPQVMAPMISATLPKRIKFSTIAKIDTTLEGVPGNTITVPKYAYIGDAADVAEGVAMGTTTLTASTTTVSIKKAGKAVEITDEALLSGYGDPAGESTTQLGMSIASKVDDDCYSALLTSPLTYTSDNAIDYAGVVDARAKFGDEVDEVLLGILYINPAQEATIRKDSNFMDKNKYGLDLVEKGAIGTICGLEVKKSKRVALNAAGTHYQCPIVLTSVTDANEDPSADATGTDAPALTIYLKRNVMVESDRDILAKTTVISADEHYGVALSNDSKVVVAEFKK